jgi:hypothetical protein
MSEEVRGHVVHLPVHVPPIPRIPGIRATLPREGHPVEVVRVPVPEDQPKRVVVTRRQSRTKDEVRPRCGVVHQHDRRGARRGRRGVGVDVALLEKRPTHDVVLPPHRPIQIGPRRLHRRPSRDAPVEVILEEQHGRRRHAVTPEAHDPGDHQHAQPSPPPTENPLHHGDSVHPPRVSTRPHPLRGRLPPTAPTVCGSRDVAANPHCHSNSAPSLSGGRRVTLA